MQPGSTRQNGDGCSSPQNFICGFRFNSEGLFSFVSTSPCSIVSHSSLLTLQRSSSAPSEATAHSQPGRRQTSARDPSSSNRWVAPCSIRFVTRICSVSAAAGLTLRHRGRGPLSARLWIAWLPQSLHLLCPICIMTICCCISARCSCDVSRPLVFPIRRPFLDFSHSTPVC